MQRLIQNIVHEVYNPVIIFLISFFVLPVLTESNPSVNWICIVDNDITALNNCMCARNKDVEITLLQGQEKYYFCSLALKDILCLLYCFKSNSNIFAIIQQGNHTPGNTTKSNLYISSHNSVTLSGNSTKDNVVLKGFNLTLSDIGETNLTNFTAEQSSLTVYGTRDPYSRSKITIANCTIKNSHVIITDMVLFIRNCEIKQCTQSAIVAYSSFIAFAGTVEFSDNTGETGGALNLRDSKIQVLENSNLTFQNNHASRFGGAIYIDNADIYVSCEGYKSFCFYSIEEMDSNYSFNFNENFADKGGDHIYGASLNSSCILVFHIYDSSNISTCSWINHEILIPINFKFQPPLNAPKSLSPISSKPTRICLCNSNHQPNCTDVDLIFHKRLIYPGEYFTIPAVIVGGDFGSTIGTVYAHFDNNFQECVQSRNDIHTMREQVITQNNVCTNLTYCFYGNKSLSTLIMYLTTSAMLAEKTENIISRVKRSLKNYSTNKTIDQTLLHTPVILNITFLPCPPGFILLENPLRCDCHPHFIKMRCTLKSGKGYISWNSTRWINTINTTTVMEGSKIITKDRCPFSYCKSSKKDIDLQHNPDAQCDFNRAGKLCGKCKDTYSLAIGSSHCIHCPNNKNLALLIFFVAVGPLLVFVISIFNLTVTQGTVNGLIFYANIVWAYQSIFFPSTKKHKHALFVLKPFIAWLNLDFGIEACFYQGLDMFSKTWLQFIFPVYTATLFFIGLKLSSKLSKLFGSRSVPTLATLLALSFTKLLRTIIAGLQLARIKTCTSELEHTCNVMSIVWALDGNLEYGKSRHGSLLFVVLACLVFLWIPYTLILFSMQWLRKIDHYHPLKQIAKYKPVYDAYFAPFKDNHHYWFGVLLLAQGALLLISSLILNIHIYAALLILLLTVLLMLCYLNFMRVYKRNVITLLESSFYINLIILSAGMLYLQEVANNAVMQEVLLTLSIGIAFIEFCAIIIWSLISWKLKKCCKKAERGLQLFRMESIDTIKDESDDYDSGSYKRYRDSILN